MDIREIPLWERPREKLLREGAGKLSTTEILAILLGAGGKDRSAMDIAGDILSLDRKGLRFLADCTPEELCSVKGLGTAKSCELIAAAELGRRIAAAPTDRKNRIAGSRDVADLFMEKMRHLCREHFYCIMMNAKGDIIESKEISVGSLTSSSAQPREVFATAIRRSASSVILVHNHPSGDPTPSEMDRKTTRRLAEAGELLGIPVLDHIVIGDGAFVSMEAEGMIERCGYRECMPGMPRNT